MSRIVTELAERLRTSPAEPDRLREPVGEHPSVRLLRRAAPRPSLFRLSEAEATADSGEVFRAYLQDVGIMPGLAQQLQTCVEGAIQAGLKVEVEDATDSERHAIAEEKWKCVREDLVSLTFDTRLGSLNARRAGPLSPTDLLHTLRDDCRQDVHAFATGFQSYLDILTEKRFLGRIEWTGDRICWYGYFRHGCRDEVRNTRQRTERTGTYTRTTEVKNRSRQHFLEYHEHHLYDARSHSIREYPELPPERVARWLKTLPAWFSDELEIVEGQIFRERIVRWDLEEEQYATEKVISFVWNYSPAVTLGNCVLVGWNGADLAEETTLPNAAEDPDDPDLQFLRDMGLV